MLVLTAEVICAWITVRRTSLVFSFRSTSISMSVEDTKLSTNKQHTLSLCGTRSDSTWCPRCGLFWLLPFTGDSYSQTKLPAASGSDNPRDRVEDSVRHWLKRGRNKIYGPQRRERGGREGEGGRKEEREEEGEKCLEGREMGIFALRSATMASRVPVHASPCGLICSQKTPRVRGPAAAAQCTVFSEREAGESSLRGAAVLAACVAQPRGAPFGLAAGQRQLRKLRGT
jgi:hypothetical protein